MKHKSKHPWKYSQTEARLAKDRRTREGQENEVLEQVKNHGGFSIFWVTENQKRAHAAERLKDCGKIKVTGGQYPWHNVEIV